MYLHVTINATLCPHNWSPDECGIIVMQIIYFWSLVSLVGWKGCVINVIFMSFWQKQYLTWYSYEYLVS